MACLIAPDPAASPESEADVSPPGDQTDVAVPASGTAAQNGVDLQAAIDAAATKTRLLLDKDGVYEGHFTIDGKTDLWIETVGLDTDPTLPDNTTHVTPASGAHLATLRLNGYGESGFLLRTINGSTGIRLRGIQCEFVSGSIAAPGAPTEWLLIGANDQDRADVPTHCHLDRVLCNRTKAADEDNVKNFVVYCATGSIRRCYFEGAMADGTESHDLYIDRTTGDVTVVDNFFGTASICVLVGGGIYGGFDPANGFITSAEEVPSGFTFRRNHFKKDPAYNTYILGELPTGFTATPVMKGGLEFKFGRTITVEGNLFEFLYSNGDNNIAAVSFSQKCNEAFSGNRWNAGHDSVVQKNVFFNCCIAIELTVGSDASAVPTTTNYVAASNIYVGHNVVFGLTKETPVGNGDTSTGHFLFVNGIKDLTVEHNTVHVNGLTGAYGLFYLDNTHYPAGLAATPDCNLTGLLIQNNTLGDFYQYSVNPDYDVTALLASVSGDATIRKNYVVDDDYATNWPGGTAAMAAANAGTFWDDFTAAPTENADHTLATFGDWTPLNTLAGYGQAAGSTGYTHPCADWALIVAAMGRLYTELS